MDVQWSSSGQNDFERRLRPRKQENESPLNTSNDGDSSGLKPSTYADPLPRMNRLELMARDETDKMWRGTCRILSERPCFDSIDRGVPGKLQPLYVDVKAVQPHDGPGSALGSRVGLAHRKEAAADITMLLGRSKEASCFSASQGAAVSLASFRQVVLPIRLKLRQ